MSNFRERNCRKPLGLCPRTRNHSKKEISVLMDSQVQLDGRLLEQVDSAWRMDRLPSDDIAVPILELPDPEPDTTTPNQTLRQQEHKWTDLMLSNLTDFQTQSSTS
ncbi:anaphase-promoting complex subunit 13 [Penaeus vannamei]|uniref:anaphase-promoting complex subunit 13 n=1 Tax=Penaeus vannamei TaxID=6689 RepID=UPI00387F37FF